MPIYEYQCNNCNTQFEEWLKVSESEKEQPCPNCHTMASRCVSQTSFVLKGSGWYVTEYGKNSATSTPTKEQNSSSHQPVSADNTKKEASEKKQENTKKTETPTSSAKQETGNTQKTQKQNTKTEKNTSA